jgi:shikimate kinase
MKRVLVMGMSGVGKSTVARSLTELGFKAVDVDYDGYCDVDEQGSYRWNVDRMQELLTTEDTEVLFVVGSCERQVLFYPQFDHIVLLSAPVDVVLERIASRTGNPFGKTPGERAKVLADIEVVEPKMRRAATHEIDTRRPVAEVVDELVSLVQLPARSS